MLSLIWKQSDGFKFQLDHLDDGNGDVEPHGVVADESDEDEEGGLPTNRP